VISAGYYLYVVKVMFMQHKTERTVEPAPIGGLTRWVIGLSAVLIIVFGFFPNSLVSVTRGAATTVTSMYPAPSAVAQHTASTTALGSK
jgi:NADH:ubiquinone oxidoreductase subunit 2 (subunit N)